MVLPWIFYQGEIEEPNFNISAAIFSQSKSISSQDTLPVGMAWNDDGSKMYMVGTQNASIYEYNLSISFDISTAVFSQSKSISAQDTSPSGIAWNDDGSKMYIVGTQNDNVYEYNLSISFDISTAVFSQSKSIIAQTNSPSSIAWNDDGSKMYIVGLLNADVHEYNLSTFFDISTAVSSQLKSISTQDTFPHGMAWNDDGSKMYMVGTQNDNIYEYNLTEP